MNRPKYLIVHHTGGTQADPLADTSHHTAAIVNNHHKTLWPGFVSTLGWHVGYHYFIDKAGQVTQCREDWEEGAHTRGYNSVSIGICLAGNFDATKPTREQKRALKNLLIRLSNKHGIVRENIVPHRKFANKTCYGRNLSDSWARDLLTADGVSSLRSFETIDLIEELKWRIANGQL